MSFTRSCIPCVGSSSSAESVERKKTSDSETLPTGGSPKMPGNIWIADTISNRSTRLIVTVFTYCEG